MPKSPQLPQIRFHAAVGQAYVRVSGKMIYLGASEPGKITPEVESRYQQVLVDHLAGISADRHSLTVDELALRYLNFARNYYRKNDEPTSEVVSVQAALKILVAVAGTLLASKFGPLKLQEVRAKMIKIGWSRGSINNAINRIRRAFRWALSQELIPATTLTALESVAGLRAGRSDARETNPVRPVADDSIEAVRPFVSRQIWGMIQLQRLTGMRPGEVVIMRGCDINQTGELWEYRPSTHKTEHHGKDRVIVVGHRAQAVLRQFWRDDPAEFLFSPIDARKEWDSKRRKERSTPMTPSQAVRKPKANPEWKAREKYDVRSYCHSVRKGCERAFNMPKELRNVSQSLPIGTQRELKAKARAWRESHCWSPNQLRHTAATEIRREFGIEAAKNTLGHSSADVTEIYAERSLDQVREIMAKIG